MTEPRKETLAGEALASLCGYPGLSFSPACLHVLFVKSGDMVSASGIILFPYLTAYRVSNFTAYSSFWASSASAAHFSGSWPSPWSFPRFVAPVLLLSPTFYSCLILPGRLPLEHQGTRLSRVNFFVSRAKTRVRNGLGFKSITVFFPFLTLSWS